MLRNKEIRQFAAFFGILSAAAIAAGFWNSAAAGILMIAFSASAGVVFSAFTKARYQKLANLADEIDLVLHNEDSIYIAEMDEGELSILQGEIAKMTLRLREQNATLKRDKEHLADSLADIAHQLRTPLTSANLILSLLKSNPDENERRTLLRENQELFAQMDWLVNALLKLSRLDAGVVELRREEIAVESLINNAAGVLAIPMELHDIALKIHIPNGTILQGDSGWLSEALQNLLKNCVEKVGDHGEIEITCEDNPIYTEIVIHDSGEGFSKEELPHVFDRFYRGKSSSVAGYGIGLALCKSIITRQDGSITAKNHPQGGALFAIRFPK